MNESKPASDSQDVWFDVLAGKPVDATTIGHHDREVAATVRRVIREEIAADRTAPEAPMSEQDWSARDARRNAFLARAAVSETSTTAPVLAIDLNQPKAGYWFSRWLPASNQGRFALVAGLAALAFAIPLSHMFVDPGNDPLGEDGMPGFRGSSAKGAMMQSADPSATAREIAARLRKVGAATRELEAQGVWTIEAKIPAEKIASATAELASQGIMVPANGIVIVVVRKQ